MFITTPFGSAVVRLVNFATSLALIFVVALTPVTVFTAVTPAATRISVSVLLWAVARLIL